MLIKEIALGNNNECYIESKITDGVNIIFSDDNNRGKTLLIQGMMFTLGNEPIFPNGFNYKNYYFYVKAIIRGVTYEFLRKGNSFFIRHEQDLRLFTSEAEYRFFFRKHIYDLPKINKRGDIQTVDFSLFYELFFVGQDNRTPSNTIYHGRFNKDDFKSMICALQGCTELSISSDDKKTLTQRKLKLSNELQSVKKKLKLVKSNPTVASYTSKYQDFIDAREIANKIENISTKITKLKSQRNRISNRVYKLISLVRELTSLNKTLSTGKLICGECKSDNIIFANKDLEFDVSNSDVKKSILISINNDIELKNEIIGDITYQINNLQEKLKDTLKVAPTDIFQIALFKDKVLTEDEYSDEAIRIQKEIDNIEQEKIENADSISGDKVNRENLTLSIVNEMMAVYKDIDPNGTLEFTDLFSKRDAVFSGSDGQEYYFSRLIAINNILKHDFPIIVDSFRDGELSTKKEHAMLDMYNRLGKQVILTSTLKEEEYASNKYNLSYVNPIDYSIHKDHKLLSTNKLEYFNDLLTSFNILDRS